MQLVLQEACGTSKDGCMWSGKDRGDLGDTMAGSTQPWNWLGEERGENDKVSTLVWKKPGNRKKQSKEASKKRRKARWGNSERVSTEKILEVEESIWKGRVRANASAKGLGPCNWVKGGICAKKGKSICIVKRRVRGSVGVCGGSTA